MSNIFGKAFSKELEAESVATRKCLERIPVELYDYKPHEKSMQLGYLTMLVAEIPKWIIDMVEKSYVDFVTFEHIQKGTTDEVVKQYDEFVTKAREVLEKAADADLEKATFTLRNGDQVLYQMPMIESISSTINHWVHHRGQLTVYMRMNDIAVPSIYGPSADEKGF